MVNNVTLVQGSGDCVPCHLEGCDRHRGSRSQCLDDVTPQTIINLINRVLEN